MSEETKQKMVEQAQSLAHVVTAKDVGAKASDKIEICPANIAVCVRVLRQGWRQGTVAVKSRSDLISRSNKKPWKQKGTGRARAGSPRSPLWRGGGVAHGPQERVKTLKVGKKMRNGVLSSVFWNQLEHGKIVRVDDSSLSVGTPKTAAAARLLRDAGLRDTKVTLFLKANDFLNQASFANIANVNTLFFDEANVYDLLARDTWVVLKKDFQAFKEMVKPWLSS
ncbi:50S ribosomal protein L4 [Candidatus Babeliales bacterium]|nr:50S ribosomal protein L4 [Candidatus Babeliales bacterium]